MTVLELINALLLMPMQAEIVLHNGGYQFIKADGNVTVSGYDEGEISLTHLTPELIKEGYTDEDVMGDEDEIVVVLW